MDLLFLRQLSLNALILRYGVPMTHLMKFVLIASLALLNQACMVLAVADAAVSTAATVVKVGVKATGAVVGAVIPDSKDDDKK
jgi:hypothetical protein